MHVINEAKPHQTIPRRCSISIRVNDALGSILELCFWPLTLMSFFHYSHVITMMVGPNQKTIIVHNKHFNGLFSIINSLPVSKRNTMLNKCNFIVIVDFKQKRRHQLAGTCCDLTLVFHDQYEKFQVMVTVWFANELLDSHTRVWKRIWVPTSVVCKVAA